MAKIEIEIQDKVTAPCFGINKFSEGIVVVEFSQECVGKVVLDTRLEPDYNSGHHSDNWGKFNRWDFVTKEFTLKFTV